MIVSGPLPVVDGRAPRVDFERRRLDEADQPVESRMAISDFGLARIARQHDMRVHAFPCVLLEECLAVDAVRAAHQRQRPPDDEGRDARPDFGVIVGEPFLGYAVFRPVEPVGMGQLHRSALRLRGRREARRRSRTISLAGLSSRKPRKEA